MSFVKYTTAFVMISLFAIALITFAINFAYDNDAAVNLASDPDYNNLNSETESQVEEFYSGSSTAYDAYQTSTISSSTEATEGGTQFKVTPTNSLAMAKTSMTSAWTKIFGSGSGFGVIFTALLGLLTFIIGVYAYKAWKGNPD